MEMVKTPKKAVLYARVSSDLQKKEKTIESQILELRKQIDHDGHILVKEYLDEGYSGARLDRPAMDELRKDIKTGLFEVIYFLNTDRIAREVTYQTIIIAEILKYKKQIIINGKDYVHNPENKFTLTVLGAVAELERAKIIERVVRGKDMKLAQKLYSGRGCNIYGYNYIHKTPSTSSGRLEINEVEAKTVKYMFEAYADRGIGWITLTRRLEENGHLTKSGNSLWTTSKVKCILKNDAYAGMMYFNKVKINREYANPVNGTIKTITKLIHRDRSEWVGIPITPIISQELFDKVQEKILYNRSRYTNPKRTQLLSNLITCGSCGSAYFASQRYGRRKLKSGERIYQTIIYCCNWRFRAREHSLKNGISRCKNRLITSHILEEKVLEAIGIIMTNPEELRKRIESLQGRKQNVLLRLKRKLQKTEKDLIAIQQQKQRMINLYACGDLDRETYVKKSLELDTKLKTIGLLKLETIQQIPVLHKETEIDIAIKQYCKTVKLRYQKSTDFETCRKLFLDFITKVTHHPESFTLEGKIPVETEQNTSYLEFKIEKKITSNDRGKRRLLWHGY